MLSFKGIPSIWKLQFLETIYVFLMTLQPVSQKNLMPVTLVLLNCGVHNVFMFYKQDKNHKLPQKVYSLNLGSAQCNTIGSMQRMPSDPHSYYVLGDG